MLLGFVTWAPSVDYVAIITATIWHPAETIALDLYSNYFLLLGKSEVFATELK